MKAQLALRMKYRLKAVRKRHCVPHGSGARARAKFQFVGQIGASSKMLLMFLLLTKSLGHECGRRGGENQACFFFFLFLLLFFFLSFPVELPESALSGISFVFRPLTTTVTGSLLFVLEVMA